MNTILASIKKRFENCSKILPNKIIIDRLELFSKNFIHEMEDKMFLIASKLSSCEEALKKEDKQTIRVEKEIQHLGHVLKLAESFKGKPKERAKRFFFRILQMKRTKKNKEVWVAKEKLVEDKHVEEVKMLSDKIDEPLLDLDKCILNELINILQSFANDPSFNVHQTSFGSYIANHVIKEKIQRCNNESMIPPKLGDVWIPKLLIDICKESHHAILDLG
jgi:hypothetical protein